MSKNLIHSVVLALYAIVGMTICSTTAFAQSQSKVSGKVIDEAGQPLPGVAIAIQGVTGGTISDLDGNFSLSVAGNDTLRVTFLGYEELVVAVDNRTDLGTLQLFPDMEMLEQVVVVGYGVQKKADLTGSVAVVDAEALKQVSNSNISTMLEGKVPGVQITTDGQPGADPTVRIRGIGSFGDTSPLYVIDGVPMGTSIRDFSPNDIETLQILKDASAAAIYGSRAANGVIIITTKRGAKDQPLKVAYSGYVGADIVPGDTYDVMNADEYCQYLGQAAANSGTSLPGGYSYNAETGKYEFQDDTDTDWYDEMFNVGMRQNHNISLSGGGANNTYNVSLDYYDQEGTIEGAGPNYERFTARVNNTFSTKFVNFQTSIVYSHSDQDNTAISNADEYIQGMYGDVPNVLESVLVIQPTIKAYDESTWVLDDTVGSASSYNYDAYGYGVYYDAIHGDISASNPLLINNLLERNTRVDRVVATGSADVDLLKMVGRGNENHKLTYRANLSYSMTHCKDFTWIPAWIQSNRVYLAKSNETLTKASRDYTAALVENILTYDGTFGDHHLNVVVGQTFQEDNTDLLTGWGMDFTEPYYLQLQNAADTYSSSYEYKHTIASFIGRLNYNFADRYLLSATVRRDGSSRLSEDIRWDVFPSVSLGWRFDKENFFPISRDIINMFKIRGSYGELGNENIGEYAYQATMARNNMTYSFGNNAVTGSAISTFVDNNLSWEKKKQYNVGLDLAFLNNRIEFTAEWYKNISEDLLYSVPVPENAGVSNTTVTMNAASMENSGLEFALTYRSDVSKAVKWEVTANASTLKNEVTSLGIGTDYYLTGDYMTYVGDEIGQFYGYVFKGIARTQADIDNHVNSEGVTITQSGVQVGDCLYEDLNGDGTITTDDRKVLESGLPALNFGLSARVEYKGFDLSVSTFGALGYHVSDYLWNVLHGSYGYGNKSVDVLDANQFNAEGVYTSNMPRTYLERPQADSMGWNGLFSERHIQNANYWKIANVELGYNFNDDWFAGYFSDVRLYVSGQNLFTFTEYEGYNIDFAGGTFTPGFNYCSFPTPRTFMAGLRFTF